MSSLPRFAVTPEGAPCGSGARPEPATRGRSPTAAAVARETFIGAMRRVANSVTVVTTDGPAGRQGATVSAFCSVSADPPTVLVCLRADSRIAVAVAANGGFCVNVLPRSRADLAERFAGRHDDRVADRFEGIACGPAGGAALAIGGVTGFCCELRESMVCGSHRICIGHVVAAWDGADEPLAYLGGAYHRVVPDADGGRSAP